MASDWQMPRRGQACVACRRSFEVGETIRAYLYESPEGYERQDYCRHCRPPDELTAIGSWQTRRREPRAKKTPPFDREAVLEFFERLQDADTPESRQLRFVLALLLWRKKVLKFERSERIDEGEVWRFVVPSTDEAHAVPRPDLDAEQLDRLGVQLEALLMGGYSDTDPAPPNSSGS